MRVKIFCRLAKCLLQQEDQNHSAQEWRDFWEYSIQPLYLKRKGKATRTTTETRNTSSETGYETAVEDSKPVVLAVTPPPTKAIQKDRARTRSPSSELKSPKLATHNENTITETVQEELGQSHSRKGPSMESDFSGSAIQRETAMEDMIQQEYGQDQSTPRGHLKRKRGDFEEDFPSSSPPEALRATKRLHLGEKQPPPVEIASTPERISERGAHQSPTAVVVGAKLGVIDLEDDGESEESDPSDYYHDEPPDDSSPLGRSASQTLSDAGGQPISITQAAFREPSPLIDFEVPAPEQGWDDDGDGEEVTELYQHQQGSPEGEGEGEGGDKTPDQQQGQQQMLPDTQALLASKTQVVDFDLPEPEGGWGDILPSSPPGTTTLSPHHPGATEDSQETDYDAQIDRFFDQQASLGRSEEDVTAALKCTCMDPDLSEKVLAYMAEHGGEIPSNTPGVWTEDDDEALDSVENNRIMRVQEKHGKQGFETRWYFLSQYRGS